MKKVFYFASCIFIFASAVFMSCSTDDTDELNQNNQQPVNTGDDPIEIKLVSMDGGVYAFFKKNLFDAYNRGKICFDIKDDTCYRIDSMEELAAFYTGTDELPAIDFSINTLLLGGKVYVDPDTDVENCKKVLSESEDGYALNLYTRHMEEWGVPGIYPLQIYYWGLYPKLEDKEITVNLIYE